MGSESANLEGRLKSLIVQLRMESEILDRIVYKSKNQHRRCLYFLYLLKVRRDVRLLLSAHLEEILNSLFQIISGKNPVQKVHLLESMKKRKCTDGRHNYQERLLGTARLLSQMVEPMVKAAIEISSLLARSFFMGFSLLILSLLARLRVLVQQILVDVVSVYNTVSSLSQKRQSIKLSGEGIEVFREYFPSNESTTTLECAWERDKFVLLEKANENNTKNPDEHVDLGREIPLQSSNIKYQTIEAFLGEDELGSQKMDANFSLKDPPGLVDTKKQRTDVSDDQPITIYSRTEVGIDEHDKSPDMSPNKKVVEKGGVTSSTSPLSSPKSQSLQTESRNKVAFVPVGNVMLSQTNQSELPKKAITTDWLAKTSNDKDDPFLSLLNDENMKDSSLF